MLKHLDDLECHPVFYRRKEIQIILNNEKSKCSSYFLDNFKPELLSVKCHEKYDVNSPEGKIYVRYSDRREEIHANFWADVKLEENYISPQDYYRQKLESN
jgi:hypothetical protein